MTEFRLTREEVASAMQLAARLQFRSPAFLLPWLVIGLAVITLIDYLDRGSAPQPPEMLLKVSGLGLALFVMTLIVPPILGPIRGSAQWNRNLGLQDNVSVEVSQAGLTYTAESGRWPHPWRNLIHVAHNDTVVLVYPGPNLMLILPKRVLSPADIAMIEEKVSSKARR